MTKRKAYRVMKDFRIDRISMVDVPAQEGAGILLMKRAHMMPPAEMEPDPEDELEDEEDEDELEKRMPARRKGESDDDFVSRMMGDEKMHAEFPDQKQRAAVAYSQAKRKKRMGKRMIMLSTAVGHTHLLDDTGFDNRTSYEKSADDDYGHSHPWIRDVDGNILIGEVDGHTHSLLGKRAAPSETLGAEYLDDEGKSLGKSSTTGKETDMDEKEKAALEKAAKEREDALTAELTLAKAFGSLNDAEKAYHNSLNDADKKAFLAKSGADRQVELAKRAELDPIVYTSGTGQTFRKSDDSRFVEMAKQADANAATAREANEKLAKASLAKRATDELGNCPGDEDAKTALLKAVDGIADQKAREGATALLKAGNDALSKAFVRNGTSQAGDAGSAPVDQLEALAKRHAETNKVPLEKARVAVLETKEGAELYEASQRR